MKRFKILILFWVLSVGSLYSQPLYDQNWNTTTLYFFDGFDFYGSQRSPWSSDHWMDDPYYNKWKAHLAGDVTHGTSERQVYQKENAIFNSSDGTMRLRAEYAGELLDTSEYEIPLNGVKHPNHGPIYYRSGAITIGQSQKEDTRYGYFEIRCKLPVTCGAFPAFWLWNDSVCYQEIDIFEYCWCITRRGEYFGTPRYFEGQIYYGTTNNHPKYGGFGYQIPVQDPDLTNWHTYGMEWTPGRVLWYFDNKLVNSYTGDKVPNIRMYLMANNAVSSDADSAGVARKAGFPNDMIINHIKAHKLDCDCPTDIPITNQTQFNTFDYKVYKTITIGGSGNNISIPSNSNVTFRATDEITISSDFSLPLGSSLNLITHPCPQ